MYSTLTEATCINSSHSHHHYWSPTTRCHFHCFHPSATQHFRTDRDGVGITPITSIRVLHTCKQLVSTRWITISTSRHRSSTRAVHIDSRLNSSIPAAVTHPHFTACHPPSRFPRSPHFLLFFFFTHSTSIGPMTTHWPRSLPPLLERARTLYRE